MTKSQEGHKDYVVGKASKKGIQHNAKLPQPRSTISNTTTEQKDATSYSGTSHTT